jgi:putative DNA primase/helicase
MSTCDVGAIAGLFAKAKHLSSGEWEACCPLHQDARASMTIGLKDDKLVAHCHAGCDQEALFKEVVKRARDAGLMLNGKERGKVVATYVYRDENGDPLFRVLRWHPKSFTQQKYDAGTWKAGTGCMKGARRVPYRLDEFIAESGTVYLVEGEKDADRLWSLGLPATTCPGGAGKWRQEYDGYFAHRDVVVIPDADAAGIAHARTICSGSSSTMSTCASPNSPAPKTSASGSTSATTSPS